MAERKPVVLVGGQLKELPAGDTLPTQAPASHSHATSDVTGLDAALAGKEPTISAGTTAQYRRGDKTWRDFATDVRGTVLTGLSTATNAAITAADTVLAALGKLQAQITSHTGSTSNPHGVTKTQVGLGNVDNTSDANKPVSTATQTALNGKEASIAAGTTAQYWRGDKSWRDFATDVRATPLTGLSTATNAAIAATDTVLVAQGKLQAQVGTKANSASVREKLTAARTYYVRTDGNDSNNGLANAAGGAFLTIQKAVDTVATLDLGIYDATIMVGAGTWTAATTLKTLVGAGKVIIRGVNDDMTSTVISVSGSSCFSGAFVGQYKISHMRLTCTGQCIDIFGGGAIVRWADVDFAAAAVHVRAFAGALGESAGNYKISGSAYSHIAVYDCGNVRVVDSSVTITGTPNFSGAFCLAGRLGNALVVSAVFSGSATGARYSSGQNSVIYTGAGELYLPGDAAGGKSTGGHYE